MRNKISRLNTIQNPEAFVEELTKASSLSRKYKLTKDIVFETLFQMPKTFKH